MNQTLRKITETAIMLAIGTVLSLLQFTGPWVLGGSITVCSMLPVVLIAHRYGTRVGAADSGYLQLAAAAAWIAERAVRAGRV